MIQNIKKIVLAIGVITLIFCGCGKDEKYKDLKKIKAGTRWKSTTAVTPANDFFYIHFIDNSSFAYCLVDYDLNQLSDMKESSYTRTSERDIVFLANEFSLQGATSSSKKIKRWGLRISPVKIRYGVDKTMTLSIEVQGVDQWGQPIQQRVVECVKINKRPKGSSGKSSSSSFEDRYLW